MYDSLLRALIDGGWIAGDGWLVQGGVLMVPIVLCSIVAVAVIVERVVQLRRGRVLAPAASGLLEAVRAGRPDEALARCLATDAALARVARAVLEPAPGAPEARAERVRDAGRREVLRLERHLGVLGAIAAVAPLLGLLGTVLGMIRAFEAIRLQGVVTDPGLLAGGIAEALVTTGAGLTVAIPAVLAHHLLLGRVDALTAELEETAHWLLRAFESAGEPPVEPAGAGAGEPAAGGDGAGGVA